MDYQEMAEAVLGMLRSRGAGEEIWPRKIWEWISQDKLGVVWTTGPDGCRIAEGQQDVTPEARLFDGVVDDLLRAGVLSHVFVSECAQPPVGAVRISQYGSEVLRDAGPGPYDPDGYLDAIRALSRLDDLVHEYVAEAVQSFRHGCFRSTVVMVGGASERVAQLLEEAMAESVDQPVREALSAYGEGLGGDSSLPAARRIALIQAVLTALRKSGNMKERPDLKEAADDIATLMQAIRRARNEHGHPVSLISTRQTAYMALQILPASLKRADTLLRWLRPEDKPGNTQ